MKIIYSYFYLRFKFSFSLGLCVETAYNYFYDDHELEDEIEGLNITFDIDLFLFRTGCILFIPYPIQKSKPNLLGGVIKPTTYTMDTNNPNNWPLDADGNPIPPAGAENTQNNSSTDGDGTISEIELEVMKKELDSSIEAIGSIIKGARRHNEKHPHHALPLAIEKLDAAKELIAGRRAELGE